MKLSPISTGALAFAVLAGGATYYVTQGDSGQGQVVATFADASPLEVGNEVRSAGVKVGTVRSISLVNGQARVVLNVDKNVLPLHQDAQLTVTPINVLGENYIAINPGSASSPYGDDTIPVSHTSTAVTLQNVLDTLNDPTSAGLAALVTTLGEGTSNGGGQQIADALKALAPMMNNLNQVGEILSNQNAVLNDLIAKADPVASSVAVNNGDQLDGLIMNAQSMLTALGDQQQALESTIQQLPSTLAVATQTLNSLDRTSSALAPALQAARPVTSNLKQIANEINNFAPTAIPAFNSFGPLFANADRLLKQAAPIATALRAATPGMVASARGLRPLGDQLLNQHLGDLMSFVTKWALSTNGRDGLSHYFRGVVHVTPAALNSLLGANILPNITPGAKSPSGSLGNLGGLLNLGGLSSTLGGITNSLGGTVSGLTNGLLAPKPSASSSATGLSQPQENNLLGQLLGGLS